MEITTFGEYQVWSDAMHGNVVYRGEIIKVFKGETAWMDAERYAEDKMVHDRHKEATTNLRLRK